MPLILRILKPKDGKLWIKVGHHADDGRRGALTVVIGDNEVISDRKIALYFDVPRVEISPVPADGAVYRVVATLKTDQDPPKKSTRNFIFPN